MRLSRKYVIAAFVAVATTAGIAVPAFAAEAVDKYVALGDSYASGLGAGDYGDSGNCKRSANAAPVLWANSHGPAAFDFVACSGAVTADVLNGQISAVTADTDLVTIAIGGNDAGFADVMTDCNLGSDDSCVSRNQEAQAFAQSELPGRLDSVYAAIRAAAPDAQVVVLGYPHIYQLEGECSVGLSETKRAAINQSSDVLADVTSAAASSAGFDFVDGRAAFAGHEICASGDAWLHSVTFPIAESYHPTAAGQSGGYFNGLVGVTG
jgi:lysophospholipase L1-like esterase